MSDLLIRGGRVIDPANGVDAVLDVWISEGRIAAVGPSLEAGRAPVLEASRLVVAPGFVDLHVHLREPGEEHKETIATGTAAAARGGFTTVCAMPNTIPAMDHAAAVDQVRRAAHSAPARVLPIGAITQGRAGERLAELANLRDAGVVAFSDDGAGIADGALARRAFEYAADLDLPIAEHCEDPALANGGVMHEGAMATRLGLRGQPAIAEVAMVERDLRLAELSGVRLHLCHLSTAMACAAVAAAKAHGVSVTAEVTPHHLYLTDAAVAGLGGAASGLAYDSHAKVSPPLRSSEDVAACRQALREGVLDAVATDHAPHSVPDKRCEFDQAASGISGLETAFGILGTLVARGDLSLPLVIERLSIGPVRAWRLDNGERSGLGSLGVGAPGDVTLLDPEAVWTVDPERFASKGKNSPLAGQQLSGWVVATVFGGRVVHEERER